ncbi:hypothetical protein [Acinetobacter soli]|uniref:hypothetical protein n=1 Tax=Acinetobacter soli TaxID=487316 RepID=UPI00125F6A94|nr:hypothetical protein [Acinetobacter soli]
MNSYKIRVNNEAESREAQELFKQLKFKLVECHRVGMVAVNDGEIYPDVIGNWDKYEGEELTLPQLRDLAVLHRNDVNDATHSCDGMSGAAINLSGSWFGYNYNEKKWQAWDEIEDDEYKISDLKPIQKPQPEQGLISGADALRAIADGKEVELKDKENNWVRANNHHLLGVFLGNAFEFRLKPRTVKLEIEVPAPFEPKVGDIYYFLNSSNLKGYGFNKFANDADDECLTFYGAWRTEAEIKIVIEQLRKIKEHSK